MPGQYHLSVDKLAAEAEEVAKLGIPSVLLFGLPEKKDEVGSEAWHPEGIVQKAIRAIKKAVPRAGGRPSTPVSANTPTTATAVCCVDGERIQVDNDATLENLGRTAVSLRPGAGATSSPRRG